MGFGILSKNIVEIFERDDWWIVRVKEDGEVFERTFRFVEHADSWAAGQKIRLRNLRTKTNTPDQ